MNYVFYIIVTLLSFLASAQNNNTERHPLFGVYRGSVTPTQSCTVSILEQRDYQTVSVLIDQNPYLFVSATQLLDLVSKPSAIFSLSSADLARHGHVEFIFAAKRKLLEVRTTYNGVTAKCSKVFQIRQQTD